MSDNFKLVQAQSFSLAGAGGTLGDTTLVLETFAQIDGTLLTMTDFGIIGYGTIQPDNRDFEEQISFTGVTQNANGSATLTGVKTVLMVSPYTETSGLAMSHPGGSSFVISNTAGFYNRFANKLDDETIEGIWTFDSAYIPKMSANVVPSDQTQLATKKYVDDTAAGTPVPINRIVMVAIAGETVVAGNQVYFDETDDEWKKTSGTFVTPQNYWTGIAQGAGTNGNPISGGVLISGLDANQSGLTPGEIYYLSDTSGAIATSAGTNVFEVGYAYSATELYYNPGFKERLTTPQKLALAGDNGTPSSSNTFVTQTGFQRGQEVYAASSAGSDTYVITLSPVPAALVTGMRIAFKADVANTGACTLNIGVGGAVAIKYNVSTDPVTGSIAASQITQVIYDGTNWQLQKASNLLEAGSTSDAQSLHVHGNLETTGINTLLTYFAWSNPVDSDQWTFVDAQIGAGNAAFTRIDPIAATWSMSGNLPAKGGTTNNNPIWSDTKTYEVEWRMQVGGGVTGDRVNGFGVAAAFVGAYNSVEERVAFAADGATLYATTGSGAAATTTDISSGINIAHWHVYKIIWNPGVNALFYVDGVLKATLTTNLPSSANSFAIGFGGQTDGEETYLHGLWFKMQM